VLRGRQTFSVCNSAGPVSDLTELDNGTKSSELAEPDYHGMNADQCVDPDVQPANTDLRLAYLGIGPGKRRSMKLTMLDQSYAN